MSRSTRSLIAFIAGMIVVAIAPASAAQEGPCRVGSRVTVEMIDNAVGTITAIGTEVPHVGWYRVVFDWNVRAGNPDGEWYSPKTREITVAGTKTKCGAAAAQPQRTESPRGPVQPAPAAGAPAKAAAQNTCPMIEPPGKVTRTASASAALFKRVIYEDMAAKVGGKSISAPKKIGLTFLEFEMGNPYRNTLTGDRVDRRLHDGAPVGAMIHPLKAKYLRCELFDREIYGYVRETSYACFKNRDGDWDCPVDSTTKTLERRTIPLR